MRIKLKITKFYLLENWIYWTHKHRNHVGMALIRVSYSPNVFLIEIHDDAVDFAAAVVDDDDAAAFVMMIDFDATYLLLHSMFQVYP